MTDRPLSQDLARIVFASLALVGMAAASLWVLWPFVAAVVWSSMIVISTWPILLWVQRRLGGRRAPAVVVMVLVLLGFLFTPVGLGIWAIVENADRVVQLAQSLAGHGLPPPPNWVERIPLAGPRIAQGWQSLAGHPDSLAARLLPHLGDATRWLVSKAGGLGSLVLQFLLTVVVSGILYASGEAAASGILRFLYRLAGKRGENAGILAAKAVRGVALGVVVTAVVQTVLAGAGLALARVPGAAVLTAVVLVLCIAQIGPFLVVAPATIWLYASGSAGRGTVMLVFGLSAVALDNFLRPFLIKKGADLPLILILAGVLGGLIGLGVVGLFVGPVVLAVTWTLLVSWVGEIDHTSPAPPGTQP